MVATGILLSVLSGISNGFFTVPIKMEKRWKWENIWFAFILMGCVILPYAFVFRAVPAWREVVAAAPSSALFSALGLGFAWGFGAICFGRAVQRLGVSIANSLMIGLSAALGSLVPLFMSGEVRANARELVLFAGILAFAIGVWLCGQAGRLRDGAVATTATASLVGYLFAIGGGVSGAFLNVGYALALPIVNAGVKMGNSHYSATNCVWMLMFAAGSIPNIAYCLFLMRRNKSAGLMFSGAAFRPWVLSVAMGLFWVGSFYLYGAATPRLGGLGLSIGWPISLSLALIVVNLMGVWLGEWRHANAPATRKMKWGVSTIFAAVVLCALSAQLAA